MKPAVTLLTTNLARGGAETQVAQLALALSGRGWPVRVVSLLTPSAYADELRAAGVPVFSVDLKRGAAAAWGAARLVTTLHRLRPRVLHAHLFHANTAARLARLVCPVPVVISTLHSAAESARESADVRWRDRIYRLTGRLADATVCVSEAVAARHRRAGAVAAGRLRVIPNGVDTARFRPDPARRREVRAALGLGGAFKWLAAGRLMWKKDYPTLLAAVARGGAGRVLIAGEGPQEGELRVLAERLAAPVRFLGAWEDIPGLMNACDALVLSSTVEGLPMVLLEAAASGLPCVATAVGGTAEAVVDGRTGYLVPPGDAQALGEAMARLVRLSPEERASMSQAARRHALEHFDMAQVTGRWEQLYLELLERARLSAREPDTEAPRR